MQGSNEPESTQEKDQNDTVGTNDPESMQDEDKMMRLAPTTLSQ